MKHKTNSLPILIAVTAGMLYALISVINHYLFRTYALDLGAYTNAMYDYIHFQMNDSSVFKEVDENLLADHFDIYLILFSPFSLIWGSYTLLIIQIIFILSGGIGVYRFFGLFRHERNFGAIAMAYFYIFFGVFSAVSYDYHSNAISAAVLPWLFYYLNKRRLFISGLLILFMLISKENTSLWLSFISLGLLVNYRNDRSVRNFLIIALVVCISYFITITGFIMPWLSNNNSYAHFNYSYLGTNAYEVVYHLFNHPIESFRVLFINHTGNPAGDYAKTEFHLILLFSGLPVLLFRPQYFLMLIPVYIQKLFNDNISIWGINAQYSIEFAPILAIGIFSVLQDMRKIRTARYIAVLTLLSATICTARMMDNTVLFFPKARIRFYQPIHYRRNYSVQKVHTMLSTIPRDAVVSAQSPFLPHLALRDRIYQFPTIKDAGYIVFSKKEDPYPIDKERFDSLTRQLEISGKWASEFNEDGFTILKKIPE